MQGKTPNNPYPRAATADEIPSISTSCPLGSVNFSLVMMFIFSSSSAILLQQETGSAQVGTDQISTPNGLIAIGTCRSVTDTFNACVTVTNKAICLVRTSSSVYLDYIRAEHLAGAGFMNWRSSGKLTYRL